jgi:uncharacterized protein HemX
MENMNEQQNTPMRGGQENQAMPAKPADSSIGATIGIIIVIIVLVLGGLYFWGSQLSKEGYNPTNDQEVQDLQNTSSSDEINAIEVDLNQDFEALDQELQQLDQELQAI